MYPGLMTGISVAVTLPSLYANMRMRRDLERQFLARRRDKLAQERDAEQLRRLKAQNTLLERLSALDPLTGLSNRRGFDQVLSLHKRERLMGVTPCLDQTE